MHEILVKSVPHVVKQNDPKTDPMHNKAVAVGQKRIREGKFKLDPENKEEYMKRVKGNPMNQPGLPAFYPPLHIRSAMNDAKPSRECPFDEGCATAKDYFVCPRCGLYVPSKEEQV